MTTSNAGSEKKTEPETTGNSTENTSPRNALTKPRKTRENVKDKGVRLLIQGRLRVTKVDGDLVMAECRGDSGSVYNLVHENGRWICTCPARTACSHLIALWLVTVAG